MSAAEIFRESLKAQKEAQLEESERLERMEKERREEAELAAEEKMQEIAALTAQLEAGSTTTLTLTQTLESPFTQPSE